MTSSPVLFGQSGYTGYRAHQALKTVLGYRAPEGSPLKGTIEKGQDRSIQEYLLTKKSPEDIVKLQYAVAKTSFLAKMQDVANQFPYPINRPEDIAKKLAQKSPNLPKLDNSAEWPDFSLDDMDQGSRKAFTSAAGLVSQAQMALNDGKHFAHAHELLMQANGKLRSLLTSDEFKLLQSTGLMGFENNDFVPEKKRRQEVIDIFTGASDKLKKGLPLNNTEQAVCHWYFFQGGHNNIKAINKELGEIWAKQKRIFQEETYRAYPVRKPDGTPHLVAKVGKSVKGHLTGKTYEPPSASHGLALLLNPDTTPAERERLRRDNILVRALKAKEKGPGEESIVNGAFAARNFQTGEFISDYGGIVLPKSIQGQITNQEYMLDAGFSQTLDGDVPLSRANTKFVNKEGTTIPVKQSMNPKDYNMEVVQHLCIMADGTPCYIGAAYATKPIKQGDELRWCYRYSPESIADLVKKLGIGQLA